MTKNTSMFPVLGMLAGFIGFLSLATTAYAKPAQSASMNRHTQPSIVEIVLKNDGEFDVLQAAVVRAGLVDMLNGNRPYTVFAPTDAAFVKTLNAGNEAGALAAIDSMSVDQLKQILLFHVTNGVRYSQSVVQAEKFLMANKSFLSQSALQTAGIASVDVQASNGVVHIIQSVLLP
jgi:uncharacterized surface protein with fasciclin (FAS1) repeats